MKRKRIFLMIILIAFLAVSFSYLTDSRKGIFPDTMGDMTLSGYDAGDVAAQQISKMYGISNIPLAKAYSAVYSSKRGTMMVWAVESSEHKIASDAFNSMNSMLGGPAGNDEHGNSGGMGQMGSSGMDRNMDMTNGNFTKPVRLNIMEFEKPDVYMFKDNKTMNYYYYKMNYNTARVYWITFDSPDIDYQVSIVKQAVREI